MLSNFSPSTGPNAAQSGPERRVGWASVEGAATLTRVGDLGRLLQARSGSAA